MGVAVDQSRRDHSAVEIDPFISAVFRRQRRCRTGPGNTVFPNHGYAVADLRGRASLTSGWTLKAGVENLGDRLYSNHLNSPDPFTRRRIPEMGRNFYAGLEYEF